MKNRRFALIIPGVVICAGVILMVFGIKQDENKAIRDKGVVVCTECIGIGDKLFPTGPYEFRVN